MGSLQKSTLEPLFYQDLLSQDASTDDHHRSDCEYARVMAARTDDRSHACGLQLWTCFCEWASGTHCYAPEPGALLGTLLCEDFCLLCTTPFTDVLGVLIEHKKIDKSLALRSKCSTFKESNHSASTVLSTNKLTNNLSLRRAHVKKLYLRFSRRLSPWLTLCWRITLVMLNLHTDVYNIQWATWYEMKGKNMPT